MVMRGDEGHCGMEVLTDDWKARRVVSGDTTGCMRVLLTPL